MIKLTPEKPPYYQNITPVAISKYSILLFTTGTTVARIQLYNNLGIIPTLTRVSAGHYTLTAIGKWPLNRTLIPPFAPFGRTWIECRNLTGDTIVGYYQIVQNAADIINIYSQNTSAVLTELGTIIGNLLPVSINIESYNV